MSKHPTTWQNTSEPKTAWSPSPKSGAAFDINPQAAENSYTYDEPGVTYDSERTYDGVTEGEPFATDKKPAVWAETAA